MQAGLNVTRLFRLERFATQRLESPSGFTLQKRFSCETMICKMQNAKKVLLQDDDADLQNIGSRILSVFVSHFNHGSWNSCRTNNWGSRVLHIPNKSHDLIIVCLLLHIETGRNFETYVPSIVGIEPSSSTQTSRLRYTTAWSTSSSFSSLVFSWSSATLSLLPSCTDLLVKILKNTANIGNYWKYWKMLKNPSWSSRGYLLLSHCYQAAQICWSGVSECFENWVFYKGRFRDFEFFKSVHYRPFHKNQILEIHIAQTGFLVLGPIETNVRKCVFPKYASFP